MASPLDDQEESYAVTLDCQGEEALSIQLSVFSASRSGGGVLKADSLEVGSDPSPRQNPPGFGISEKS
jgi:hypothetical protein